MARHTINVYSNPNNLQVPTWFNSDFGLMVSEDAAEAICRKNGVKLHHVNNENSLRVGARSIYTAATSGGTVQFAIN
ncbi:MAG: hypothetical protein HQL45_14385 [Alphaproteobacteria bacterium]|nr:hypothetical protein [Alphaproteobacteria bacterium]